MSQQYRDIIHLPKHISQRHAPMSLQDRAAQFAPFAALTGYEDVIAESGRLTEGRIELDEGEKTLLNEKLTYLRQNPSARIRVVCFQVDSRKAGGAYRVITGRVKKLDNYAKTLVLTDGTVISIEDIFGIELE